MRHLAPLCLLALMPALGPVGHADESSRPTDRYRRAASPGEARSLERPGPGVEAPAPAAAPLDVLRERLLAAAPVDGRNSLTGYLSGDIHPTRIEAVGRHLLYREAGRQWRRLASESLNHIYESDPSYGPHELGVDKRRMSDAWRLRDARGSEGLHVARVAPAPGIARRDCGLYQSRFLGIDRNLRLRMNVPELVGIVIGDGPEDEFEFDRPASDRQRRKDGPRLPRLQIRGQGRVRVDTRALGTASGLTSPLESYGGVVSVDFISPSRAAKIVTAFFEAGWKGDGESEVTFGLKRRF